MTFSRTPVCLALGLLFTCATAQGAHADDVVFVCDDRDLAVELAELANEYNMQMMEIGRVTMADRHGGDMLYRQAWGRATQARANGVCGFTHAFDHHLVATLYVGAESLAAAGLARHVHEVIALDSGETRYLIAMGQL